MGKTTMLRELLGSASERGWTLLSCRPVESETKLAYAALADLLAPVGADVATELPRPQCEALEAVLLSGDIDGGDPDERAISLAFLSVLDILARSAPVIVAVDNGHRLDDPSAEVLRFVARRLLSRPVAIIVCVRAGQFTGVPLGLDHGLDPGRLSRVRLDPLSPITVGHLIVSHTGHSFSRLVLQRLITESAGNPLVALELARTLWRSGGVAAADPLPVPAQANQLVAGLMGDLSSPARNMVVAASAASRPTVDLVLAVTGEASWHAAGGQVAEDSEILEVTNGNIRFLHPLLAAAVYASSPPEQRRALHRGLAKALKDPEERARHLGRAAIPPDVAAAAALDEGAGRAWRRGDPGAAAELAELALRLTPDFPDDNGDLYRRGLDAAGYLMEAGGVAEARTVLEETLPHAAPGPARAEGLRRLALAVDESEGARAAADLFRQALDAAADLPSSAAVVQRDMAWSALRHGHLVEAVHDARRAVDLARRAGDVRLDEETSVTLALTQFLLSPWPPGESLPRPPARVDDGPGVPLGFRTGPVAAALCKWTGDAEAARRGFEQEYKWATERGRGRHPPSLLWQMSELERAGGNLAGASALADQAVAAARLSDDRSTLAGALLERGTVAVCAGRAEPGRHDLEQALDLGADSPWATMGSLAALGLLELSLGDPGGAYHHLHPATQRARSMDLGNPALLSFATDEVEALVGLGRLVEAEVLLDWYEERARSVSRTSALAMAHRCRALLLAATGDLTGATAAVEAALDTHALLHLPLDRGRALLVHGRVLRRAKERGAAQKSLEGAQGLFGEIGARLWEANAVAELTRMGRGPRVRGGLTPTEGRVAELAAVGHTNREIAALAFIAPKSVEANLSRVYAKLGVHSRSEPSAALKEIVSPEILALGGRGS